MDLIESGDVARRPITAGAEALVAYVRTIGLQAGDQQILTVQSPDRTALSEYRLQRSITTRLNPSFPPEEKPREVAWPTGIYVASYRVVRDGTEVLSKEFRISVNSK